MMRPHHFSAARLTFYCAIASCAIALGASPAARATEEAPDELPLRMLAMTPSPWKDFRLTLGGYLRVRGDVWNDLDLSRGPTPSTGQPIFPTPAAGGNDHTITAADMRVRLEPTLEVGQAVRVHLRVDVLDNVGFGSTPDVLPSYSSFAIATQNAVSPEGGFNALHDAIRVKQAWGEVTLPFGVLSAGRMGALVSWGTGFFINNGDCLGCDYGDSGDRIALTVPILGHYVSALYELSASGPYIVPAAQPIDLDRRAQVNTAAVSIVKLDSVEAQRRKLRAGRALVNYGLLASYRRQDLDAPAWTQPGGLVRSYSAGDFVARDLESFAGDAWLLVHAGGFRAEFEFATVLGRIGDATNSPGVSVRTPVTATQLGGVASVSYAFRWPLRLRVEVGAASGDDAPGFGITGNVLIPKKGDLDGAQIHLPGDTTIDNFRFHPDYHVDLILWRRIVGAVTDGVYFRPSVKLGPFGSPHHNVAFEAAFIESSSLNATTPPGQAAHLGEEIDLSMRYRYEPAFEVGIQYGVFVPGAGFRNLDLNLAPQPAQALEVILAYRL
ncbi:MAG TPA: TIGR04551 family protein [Polyangia bacterium]